MVNTSAFTPATVELGREISFGHYTLQRSSLCICGFVGVFILEFQA